MRAPSVKECTSAVPPSHTNHQSFHRSRGPPNNEVFSLIGDMHISIGQAKGMGPISKRRFQLVNLEQERICELARICTRQTIASGWGVLIERTNQTELPEVPNTCKAYGLCARWPFSKLAKGIGTRRCNGRDMQAQRQWKLLCKEGGAVPEEGPNGLEGTNVGRLSMTCLPKLPKLSLGLAELSGTELFSIDNASESEISSSSEVSSPSPLKDKTVDLAIWTGRSHRRRLT